MAERVTGLKSKFINELHARGIYRADKQGVGRVKLEHFKTAELARLITELENAEDK